MLWWGWLSFNAGSTFGISGNKWRLSAKVIEKEIKSLPPTLVFYSA